MPDLRKKILYTIFMLLIYRMLCFIPAPGVDHAVIKTAMENYSLLGYINSITGSNMGNYSIMAMGITPYINASIIMQLLTVAIPKLEEMNKEEEGRKKIAQITRYVTVALGFLQAVALTTGLQAASGFLNVLTIGFCLATGTCLAMWLGERITEKGIGNGISLLIFAGIISRFAGSVVTAISDMFKSGFGTSGITYVVVFTVSVLMIVAVVFINLGERRVPVQYAKRMVGRKMYGGQSTHIPLKVDASGVLPLIFASAIMQFPPTILAFFQNSNGAYQWWEQNVAYGSWPYQTIFALMIFGFTFFYSTISFNPVEISKNIQQNGGMIPGIRQGRPTSDFLAKTVRRITLFGAIYLALLATIPTIFYHLVGASLPFAASSLLIAVSVSLETTRQLESHMTMRNYKGFLK